MTGRFGRVEATDECDDCGRLRPIRQLEAVLDGETVRRVCPGCDV